MGKQGVTIKATRTSLSILEKLNELNGAGVTQLAGELGLPKSTVHNHLKTLLEAEYVVHEGDEYDISLQFLELGEYSRNRLKLYKTARPEVENLAVETGEMANLAVEEYGRGVYLYLAEGEQAVQLDTCAGMHVHLHCTALGKAMLAHMPRERVEDIVDRMGLPKRTENTITDRDELFEELDAVRERGYAYDNQERLTGLCCVAAPINRRDRNIGAISIAGPTNRMNCVRYHDEFPELLFNATNVIELNMTYS